MQFPRTYVLGYDRRGYRERDQKVLSVFCPCTDNSRDFVFFPPSTGTETARCHGAPAPYRGYLPGSSSEGNCCCRDKGEKDFPVPYWKARYPLGALLKFLADLPVVVLVCIFVLVGSSKFCPAENISCFLVVLAFTFYEVFLLDQL